MLNKKIEFGNEMLAVFSLFKKNSHINNYELKSVEQAIL